MLSWEELRSNGRNLLSGTEEMYITEGGRMARETVDVEGQDYFFGLIVKDDLAGMMDEYGEFAVRVEYKPGELSQYILCVNAGKDKQLDVKEFPIGREGTKFTLNGNQYDGIIPLIDDLFNQKTRLPATEGVEDLQLKQPAKRPTWELRHEMIAVNNDDVLGSGQFGKVCTGELTLGGKKVKVAVKVANTSEDSKVLLDTLKEARAMRNIEHPNCIKLYGIVTEREPILLVIELVNTGSLISYLRKQREEPLTNMDKAMLALQAAWGLEYLHTKSVIHRDIAARNCLLNKPEDSDKLQLKIADFGLSRVGDKYTITRKGTLPVRYMPPESIEHGIFSSTTDVWMFGALMFEIYSDGKELYKGFKVAQVKEMVKKGELQQIPDEFPNHAKELIGACWQIDASTRPSMKDLASALEKYTKETVPVLTDPTMERNSARKKEKTALSMEKALASGRVKKTKSVMQEEKTDKKDAPSMRKTDASGRGSMRKTKAKKNAAPAPAKKSAEGSARSGRGKKGKPPPKGTKSTMKK